MSRWLRVFEACELGCMMLGTGPRCVDVAVSRERHFGSSFFLVVHAWFRTRSGCDSELLVMIVSDRRLLRRGMSRVGGQWHLHICAFF